MKKLFSLILAAAMTLSMVSCSENGKNQSDSETADDTSSAADFANRSEFGTIDSNGLSSVIGNDISFPTKKGSDSSDSVEYVENFTFDSGYTYTGYLKNGKPSGYGCLKLSNSAEATCSNWVDGIPNGTVWQCTKGNKQIDYRDSTMVNNIENGECNILQVYYTDSEYKTIGQMCFTSAEMVNGKVNGDVVSYLILDDGMIAIGTNTAKNGELIGKWHCVITDGEKIYDEGDIDTEGKDKKGGFIEKVKGMISKIGNVAKAALSTVKKAIVNIADKIKGLTPSQKERVKKVSKFLAGQYIESFGEDDEAARKYKEEHPIKSAVKEFHDTFTTIKGAKEAFID